MGWGAVAGLFLALDAWYKQTNSPEETQPAKRSGDSVVGVGGAYCFLLAVLVTVSLDQMSEKKEPGRLCSGRTKRPQFTQFSCCWVPPHPPPAYILSRGCQIKYEVALQIRPSDRQVNKHSRKRRTSAERLEMTFFF